MIPLFILDFQRGSEEVSLCKVLSISDHGVLFKWILSFRCHCHIVEYRTMTLRCFAVGLLCVITHPLNLACVSIISENS